MNEEQAQTAPATYKWVTVDEAFMLCQDAGLDRTKKTIRSWCRHEHVDGKKQSTPIGERWMVEANSLHVKIRSELEFQRQSEPIHTSANQFEQVRTTDTPVRTSAHSSEQERTDTDQQEPQTATSQVDTKKIAELEREVRSLEIDKAVRDRHVEFLTEQNKEGQKNLLSQSRYIGHLETQVMQLGGRPDQQFLEAPVPSERETAQPFAEENEVGQPHPNQRQFDIHTDMKGRQ